MTGSKGRAPIISLGSDFGTAIVQGAGIKVELTDNGDVTVHTNGSVKLRPAANDGVNAPRVIEPQIGDVMPPGHAHAGWIYMGPDDDTGELFYAAPKDESGTFTFNQAAKRAKSVSAKLPSQSQLDKMYRNKDKAALKDTFNATGSTSAGWYWSSRVGSFYAWAQRFSDGIQDFSNKNGDSSVRLVR